MTNKFRVSKDVIPLINSTLDILQKYGSELDNSDIRISKEVHDASGLEKEFYAMFSRITEEFIKLMMKNVVLFSIMVQGLTLGGLVRLHALTPWTQSQ